MGVSKLPMGAARRRSLRSLSPRFLHPVLCCAITAQHGTLGERAKRAVRINIKCVSLLQMIRIKAKRSVRR